MSGAMLKGALISYFPPSGAGASPQPNTIVFQINPETMTHAWTESTAPQPASDSKVKFSPLAVAGPPGESFTFTLMLDSDEQIADGDTDPNGASLAASSGVYARLAALELLQFPTGGPPSGLVGGVSAASSAASVGASAASSSTQSVPESQVPVVLFVWGKSRIVPVRVTAFSVSEKLYDEALNPTHVEAQITIAVLTPDELAAVQGPMAGIAQTAYSQTQSFRQSQAAMNAQAASPSVLGMLPAPL